MLVAATTGALVVVTPLFKDERFHAFTFSLAQGVSVASGVALSRVDAGSHFLNDVASGSTLGLVGGLTATRTSDRIAARRVAVVPYSAPGTLGIDVAWRLDHEVKPGRFDRQTY